jgi:hypothetical protein
MALVTNSGMSADFTIISFTSDFRINLPDFKLAATGIQVCLEGNVGNWIAIMSSTQLRADIDNNSVFLNFPTALSAGDVLTGVYLERIGTTVTLGYAGLTNTITNSSAFSVKRYIKFSASQYSFAPGTEVSGTCSITGTGATDAEHDFDQLVGATSALDLLGSNDAVLAGVTTGGFNGVSPADITIVTQPTQTQIFPRTSSVGGLFSKGQASTTIKATGEGVLQYRLVDENQTTEVVTWADFTSGVDFTLTVPANAQWFKVEFRKDGVSKIFSNKFSCGGVTLTSGQSLAVRMFNNIGDSTTLANLGLTPSSFHSTYASLQDGGFTARGWRQVADSTIIDSAFAADFLNRKIAQEGVCWALIGYCDGGDPIATFLPPSSTGYLANLNIINDVGGFHEWIWFQGHSNFNTSYASYKADLHTLNNKMISDNALGAIDVYTLAIPNINSSSYGNVEQNAELRRAHLDFNIENNSVYVNATDIEMVGDGIHQSQIGNLSLSRNFFRAQYASSLGPSFKSITRAAAVINVQFNLKSDSTALVGVGNPTGLVSVSLVSNPFTLLAVNSVTVNTDSIDITLASDPSTDALLIWFGSSKNNNGSASIRDNYTADGFSVGRNIRRTVDFFGGEMLYNNNIRLLPIAITGIPDGSYLTELFNAEGKRVYSASLAYASGIASASISDPIGTHYGLVRDNNTPSIKSAPIKTSL